jgi:hypothetical protein
MEVENSSEKRQNSSGERRLFGILKQKTRFFKGEGILPWGLGFDILGSGGWEDFKGVGEKRV